MLSARPELLTDDHGRWVGDPAGNVIGVDGPLVRRRIQFALPLDGLSGYRRYDNCWPADDAQLWMDFSALIPKGVGITSATLQFFSNTVPPAATSDFTTSGAILIDDRAVYTQVQGGVNGKDYQLLWTVNTSDDNVWKRTVLLLCANTT